ncbi:MAG: hypothetical protein RML93_02845 [Anaerolineales bacterium]|nr:hypothetical protein [Anaerolineales bacterium]MCS7248808.1 hypothetical protein [Anaerolineales bacterium]MDW8162621.1 hypothetical protein [Anaerolineales bacterium]MDW8446212.1 hypothetical protein [Anaerolineales bacterium]
MSRDLPLRRTFGREPYRHPLNAGVAAIKGSGSTEARRSLRKAAEMKPCRSPALGSGSLSPLQTYKSKKGYLESLGD